MYTNIALMVQKLQHTMNITTLTFVLPLIQYEGVSKSSENHLEVKEPEYLFWYVILKTSSLMYVVTLRSHTFIPLFIECSQTVQTEMVMRIHAMSIHLNV